MRNKIITLDRRTALVRLTLQLPDLFLRGAAFAKAEYREPTGSVKYRAAGPLLADTLLKHPRVKGVTDATSGGAGKALARVARVRGLRSVFFLPARLSRRARLIEEEGGLVVLVDGDIATAQKAAAEFSKHDERFAYVDQFHNPVSVAVHENETAVEISAQLPAVYKQARVISGSGTGATLAGVSRGLRALGYRVRSICAVPVDEKKSFSSAIPGVVDRASVFLDWDTIETISVLDTVALAATRHLIGDGIPVGPSSGLNVAASALSTMREPLSDDECVVTFLPDEACRYTESHPELFAA